MADVPQAHVMVVEDEVLLLEAISKKLQMNGINVISCTNGKQALDYLRNMPTLPNAIWLDYYLRDMDGLEFMEELKKNEAWAKIPVIVVSNSASTDKVHRMLALGASDYLLKSDYRLEQIISILRDFINKQNTNEKGVNS